MMTYQNIASLVLTEMVETEVNFAQACNNVKDIHLDGNLSFQDIQVVKEFLINHLDTLEYLEEKVYNQYKRGFATIQQVNKYTEQIEAIYSILNPNLFTIEG